MFGLFRLIINCKTKLLKMENYSPIEKWDGFEKYADKGYGHNYGTVRQLDNKRKPIKFNVNKLLVAGEKVDFRYVTKCKAGWPVIGEVRTTPKGMTHYISKTRHVSNSSELEKMVLSSGCLS